VRVLFVHHEQPLDGGTYDDVVAGAGHEIARWAPFLGEPLPELDGIDALLVHGGAVHPDADGSEPWLAREVALIEEAVRRDVPTLGICLGAQLIARAAGARVGRARTSEVGWYLVEPNEAGLADPVVRTLGGPTHAFEWHHYTYELPEGAQELARSERATQAFRFGERVWGVQFHPEVRRDMVYDWTGMAPTQVDGDPQAMLAETDERIDAWNETGRRLCLAFLREAASTAPSRSGSDLGSDPVSGER
jgi:GMP synthase (glutamine-hydrolysing)